jgi:hypothetical protein
MKIIIHLNTYTSEIDIQFDSQLRITCEFETTQEKIKNFLKKNF